MLLKSHYNEDENIIECGCDEVGRGCLAGPVFAAAVILPYDYTHSEIKDSKMLNRKKRENLREVILKDAISYAVASISAEEIDKINILNASIQCMNLAIKQLNLQPSFLLIDGNRFYTDTNIPYRCVVKGDATYLSIAAASILAKTYRDEYMEKLDLKYNMYQWKKNKGYPTAEHRNAIISYGLSPYHRKSFHVKNQLSFDF